MKAILVVDIPNGLSLSDLYISGGLWEAGQDDGWEYEFKPEDIKPMPKKKIHIAKYNIWKECSKEDKEIMLENKGYNKCIDEILGG